MLTTWSGNGRFSVGKSFLSFGQEYEKSGLSMTAAPNETGPLRRPRTYFMITIIAGQDFTFNPPNTEFFTLLLWKQPLEQNSYSSGIYSAISSNLQSNAEHNLFSVFVSILSFARKRRTVLLSIPHFSRNKYVEMPFSFITIHSLSKIITYSPPD